TLLVSNLLLAGKSDTQIAGEANRVVRAASGAACAIIVVSNEVGCGIVPENALARRFRDIAGLVNQIVARAADEVFLAVSGIPVRIR
ncbi:MAG: bifunctional adenosylcobinamide kinase/adenosylcobinamide-phosphate guanylyltransferase, partial [Planctomycetota bacterium]|nr:bifunctional adenosylcobinamide kinase/adenosylcobinamide-phosphate guanylyltransferase [Planctomycetota bacterium]